MDRGVFWDGNWYTGTGTTPSGQYDFQGVITQEFGHWLGLGHKSCSSMYEVPPDLEITTLCPTDLDEKMRSLSQDDLQGVEIWFDATFAINRGFEDCCDGVNVAKYWSVTPGANKVLWCSGGAHSGSCLMGLNDNPSVPYPELYQFASGPDIDVDNDGRFMIRAWVKAVHNAVTPRAGVFIRHWHGSYSAGYANHEQKCDSGTLTVGVWTKVQCTFTLGSYTQQTFQYGVRVTEKIDIDDVWCQDNQGYEPADSSVAPICALSFSAIRLRQATTRTSGYRLYGLLDARLVLDGPSIWP